MKDLHTRYWHAFSTTDSDLGTTDVATHGIETGNAPPIWQQLRRSPQDHFRTCGQIVGYRWQDPSANTSACNIILVWKAAFSLLCRLQAIGYGDQKRCAFIAQDWLLSRRHGERPTVVHLRPKIVLPPKKSKFICPSGMYCFRVEPIGLCNTGATLQCLMDIVMTRLHLDICLVYVDDIIVYSCTPEEHIDRLSTVFERLHRAGLKL